MTQLRNFASFHHRRCSIRCSASGNDVARKAGSLFDWDGPRSRKFRWQKGRDSSGNIKADDLGTNEQQIPYLAFLDSRVRRKVIPLKGGPRLTIVVHSAVSLSSTQRRATLSEGPLHGERASSALGAQNKQHLRRRGCGWWRAFLIERT